LTSHMGDVKVYENLAVLPRAYVVHRLVATSSDADALSYLKSLDFRPADEAVIAADSIGEAERVLVDGLPYGNRHGKAEVIDYRAESVVVSVNTVEPGMLVLTDAHYPGWEATLDGVATPIHRVNHLFRGVAVPRGEHTVRFDYRPVSVQLGVAISVVGAVAALIIVGLPLARRSRPSSARPA